MTAATGVRESLARRAGRAALTAAVRGHRGARRGPDWGEAVLAEYDETVGDAAALRWAAGGMLFAWRERIREGARPLALVWDHGWPRRLAVLAVVAAALLLAGERWVMSVVHVPSGSMAPGLGIGDRFLLDRVSHHVAGPGHGDRVVIDGWTPENRGHRFTLRVIGLPGDEISCAGGAVHRNGVRLDEPYAAGLTDCTPVTVPTGTLYLLGDNRDVADDSRFQGPADASGVRGRVLGRVPFS